MRECWLRPNRRALSMGLVLPVLIALPGLVMALSAGMSVLVWIGWAMVAVGAITFAMVIYFMRLPRLAYEDGNLLVYLESSGAIRVPIEIVECFFLGQTTSSIKSPDGETTETSTVVVRLAESATQWHHRDVKPALGHWCDAYITIYGTWCEPLTTEVFSRMNKRLAEVHREVRRNQEIES